MDALIHLCVLSAFLFTVNCNGGMRGVASGIGKALTNTILLDILKT